jgi:hypothetical protein
LVGQPQVERPGDRLLAVHVAIAEQHVGQLVMTEVRVRVARAVVGVDIIKLLEHGPLGRGRRLEVVDLRRVGHEDGFGGAKHGGHLHRGFGQMQVVAVAEGRAPGFQFVERAPVIQGRADLHPFALEIRVEQAQTRIEVALSFCAGLEPAEPVALAAID